MHVIVAPGGRSFRKVVLIEYPRKGLWSIAFITQDHVAGAESVGMPEDMLTVFVPTTPNPTSGYLLLVPESSVVPVDMSVDEALKMVISLGMVMPLLRPELPEMPVQQDKSTDSDISTS